MDSEMVPDLYPVIPDMDPVRHRQPSFREKFLFYLKTNANPELLLKLMQSSRYFCFRGFPYFVIKDLRFLQTLEYLALGKNEDLKILPDGNGRYYGIDNFESLDLDNLEKPLWITNTFEVRWSTSWSESSTRIASKVIPKVAVCQIKVLYLADQILTFDEMKFLVLSKSVEDFIFHRGQVKYTDGSDVPIDEVVKFMPKLKKFDWNSGDMPLKVAPETTKNLINYLNPTILTHIWLSGIPDTFDFDFFVAAFMDKYPSISFELIYDGPPISAAYSKMLQTYVDKLIEIGAYKTRRIKIYFPLLSWKQWDVLNEEFHSKS